MAQPIIARLPQLQAQVARKYGARSPQAPFLDSLPPLINTTLQNIDLARINQGQNPYTADETKVAGTAAAANKDVINADQPWYRDFVSDISDVATSIPKLPFALYHEATELPNMPAAIQAGIDKAGGNPIEAIGNVAQAPGVRMLPGSFTASQFGTGGQGFGGLTEHPGYTLLDLLPVAEEAAGLTKTVKAAKALSLENAATLGELPQRVRPLTTLATRGHFGGPEVVDTAALGTTAEGLPRTMQSLAPNPLGQLTGRVGTELGGTRIGQLAKRITGRNSQTGMQIYNRANADINGWALDPERAPTPLTKSASQILKDSAASHPDFAAIPEARQVEIGQGLALSNLSDLSLSPVETRYAAAVKQGVNALGDAAEANKVLGAVNFAHGKELFPIDVANQINTMRAYSRRAQAADLLRTDIANPENADIATTHFMFAHMLADDTLTIAQKEPLARAYLANLEQLGADVTPARRAIRDQGINGFAQSGLVNEMELPASSPIIKTSPTADPLTTSAQAALANLDNIRLTNRGTRGTTTFSAEGSAKVQAASAQLEASTAPARWDDLIARDADKRIAAKLSTQFAGRPSLDAHLQFAAEHSFEQVPATAGLDADGATFTNEANAIYRDARKSWQELAAQGLDPVFRHRVDPTRAYHELAFPKALDHPVSPSQLKARTWDAASSVTNPMVALQHQAMEFLIQAGTRQFLDGYITHLATPGSALVRDLAPAYRAMAEENLSADVRAHISTAISKAGFTAFDPESFIKGGTPKTGVAISKQLFLPTEVADNLVHLRPQPQTIAGTLAGTPMKVFRTSVLALSPRWHANNILGGLVMVMGQARNPVTMWKYAADAWKMAKEGGIGGMEVPGVSREAMGLATPGGKVAMEAKNFKDIDLARAAQANPLHFLHNYGAGQTLRRLWDGAQKGIEGSYKFNQFVDDFYRSMAYLEGSRAIPGSLGKEFEFVKGMTRDEQAKAGILKSNSVLQQWDKLTPLERSTMRMVMPFYAWAKTVLKYAVQLPVDHPWRVNVIANIARAEQADMGTGIPQHLRHLLFLGDPDADGNVKAINLAGANPFTDVANYASLAGFFAGGQGNLGAITANMNPMLSTTLQYMGVDTQRGQAELAPDLAFDPVTGALALQQGTHPALTALNNLLPQSRAVTSLAGWSQDFRDLASRDPSAAARSLASSLGMPAALRQVNVPTEVAKDQARQYGNMVATRNAALKSGDLGLMAQYPGLRAFRARAEKLQANQGAAKYAPDPNLAGGKGPSAGELLARAATQQ